MGEQWAVVSAVDEPDQNCEQFRNYKHGQIRIQCVKHAESSQKILCDAMRQDIPVLHESSLPVLQTRHPHSAACAFGGLIKISASNEYSIPQISVGY